ncbi:MAG: crotonase [Streptosporangiaceae bacterium]|jgi:enoyl-CoA hydratase|nr:crotonase [Streptosporangiaceae bacterium]
MTVESVVVVDETGPVSVVRLNRPRAHNALSSRVLAELDTTISDLAARPATRVIVVTGTGQKAFSAGADLDELAGLRTESAHDLLSAGQRVMRRIEECPVPIIAAVNGLALGGGFELILAATFPVLARNATLGLPEAGLGLIPGYGGTQRLARRVGATVATHLMLTGSRLTADRAYHLGLTPVEPVEPDALLSATRVIAEQIATRGPRAVRAILAACRLGADAPLPVALALESALAGIATAGHEGGEGVAAFREKRPAQFADIEREHGR